MAFRIIVRGMAEARALAAHWNPAAFAAGLGPLAGASVLDALRLFINRKTGAAANSLNFTQAGNHVLFQGNDVAGYLYTGTRPHTIAARNGRVLAFQGRDGSTVFARGVNHPGTQPYPYPEQAAAASAPTLSALAREQAIAALFGGA